MERWWREELGVLYAVEVLGARVIRGLAGRGGGGGRVALKLGRRFLPPPEAAFRKFPALLLMPGDAVLEMELLSLGTGESMSEPGAMMDALLWVMESGGGAS